MPIRNAASVSRCAFMRTSRSLCRRCVSPLLRIAVREPREYRYSREPPLFAKAPARQVALLGARPDSVSWELEKRGRLLEGEHFVGERGRSVCHLNSAHGNGTSARRQPICKQFADQVLFMTASHASETVEGCCLIFRQPDK
jgi:hypothetical protein